MVQRGEEAMKPTQYHLTLLVAFISLTLTFGAHPTFANVSVEEMGPVPEIVISGEIRAEDVAAFSAALDRTDGKPRINLSGSGGDVNAAIAIGRIIRKHQLFLLATDKCYSSCALIYIGSVYRTSLSFIGLHRPYFRGKPQSASQLQQALPKMILDIKAYVREMGITDEFTNAMLNTPPEGMLVFKADEIYKLVPKSDPLWDEITTSYSARKYGISTDEYRRRDASIADKCAIKDFSFCSEAVKWGLSVDVYRSREQVRSERCKFSDADRKLLQPIQKAGGWWQESEIVIKFEDCARAVMLDR
jgi:hypothetical protein